MANQYKTNKAYDQQDIAYLFGLLSEWVDIGPQLSKSKI